MATEYGQIGFSEEQADLLDVAGGFCRERSPMDKVRALIEDDLGHDPAVWTEIAELGWLGVAIPESHGGAGLSLAEVVPLVEQMGRRLMAGPFVSTTLAAQALLAGGTEAQKAQWLPRLASGTPAALALAEDEDPWELERVSARAEPAKNGLALSGRKILVQDAGAADLLLVSLLHDGAPVLALVETAGLPAVALRRETAIDETRRAFELTLDNVAVPDHALLDPARAIETFKRLHLAMALLSAAEMCGGAKACLDYTVDYLKTRKQFGKLIGAYQALKHPVVDAYVMYEQARSHLYAAAHCFDDQGAGEIATRMAKATADRALSYIADRAIQFHGGFGFTYECDAQLYRRRALWHASQYGDATFHKRKLAELVL